MDSLIGVGLALGISVVCSYLIRREIRRSKEWVSPFTVLLVFAVLDVYLAALRFLTFGDLWLPPWMVPLSSRDLVDGMVWFTIGTAFLLVGIKIASGRSRKHSDAVALVSLGELRIRVGTIYSLLAASLFLYAGSFIQRVHEAGSFSAFIEARALSRYSPATLNTSAESSGALVSTYLNGASLTMIMMLVGILFFCRVRYRKPLLWGFLLPALAWLCTLSTFFRGYQLSLFVGLFALETYRLRAERPIGVPQDAPRLARHYLSRRRLYVMIAVPVIFFISYGALRSILHETYNRATPEAISPWSAIGKQIEDLTQGASLVGASEMAKLFDDQYRYLGGDTITGSLLLPVPRFFWHSKPPVSGFLAVSAEVGWAKSTQSAVSWPGEFYANFGPIGLPLLLLVGLFVGWFQRRRLRPSVLFVYIFGLIPAIMVSHWMSILGMVNLLIYTPLLYLAARFVVRVPQPTDVQTGAIVQPSRSGPYAIQPQSHLLPHID